MQITPLTKYSFLLSPAFLCVGFILKKSLQVAARMATSVSQIMSYLFSFFLSSYIGHIQRSSLGYMPGLEKQSLSFWLVQPRSPASHWKQGVELASFKSKDFSLAGVAQWIECRPANQRITCSIPSLGHMPGLWARSLVGGARETTTHWCFSPFLPSFPFLKINK